MDGKNAVYEELALEELKKLSPDGWGRHAGREIQC